MRPVALFDIDLTLIRTNRAGREAMRLAFEALGLDGRLLASLPIDGRTDRAIFLDALERLGVPKSDQSRRLVRVVEQYLERLPGQLAERGGRVLPGAAEVVAALRTRGWALGLATGNLRQGAETKLRFFHLWDAFAFGGFGDRATDRLDVVTEAVRAAEAYLGSAVDPAATWVIGDTPLDVEAAHRAGLRALAVATGNYPREILQAAGPDAVVDSLADVRAVLTLLGA